MCLTTGAFAQDSAPDTSPNPEVDQMVVLLQAVLNLNPSQATKIRELAQAHHDEIASMEEQAAPKLQQLQSLLDDPNSNPEAVGKLSMELQAARKQIAVKQAAVEKQLLEVLSDAQQEEVKNLGRSAEVLALLHKLGLIDPDLADGIFMRGLKLPTGGNGGGGKTATQSVRNNF
jgi:Spy/CpxP family protein refolding chaperone